MTTTSGWCIHGVAYGPNWSCGQCDADQRQVPHDLGCQCWPHASVSQLTEAEGETARLRGKLALAEARLAAAEATIARLHGVLYGGIERPADDPGQLDAIADWLDRVDDLTDAELAGRGSTYRVGRTVQADLRRIATEIERLREETKRRVPSVRERLREHGLPVPSGPLNQTEIDWLTRRPIWEEDDEAIDSYAAHDAENEADR